MIFLFRLKEFKFEKEFVLKGAYKSKEGIKRVKLKYYLDKKYQKLINKTERLFKFHFTLKLLPDICELNMDGKCIIESPQQSEIESLININFMPFIKFVNNQIVRNCIVNSIKICNKNEIPIPPAIFLFEQLNI